jgi:uncharacterized protein
MDKTSPTRTFITKVFKSAAAEGLGGSFLDHLADDVHWNATGSSPLSGVYTSKQLYQQDVLGRLKDKLEYVPRPEIDRILVDGDWATVLFHTTGAKAKNGIDFSMQYCWLLRVQNEKIVEVVGFFDQKKATEVFA